MEREQGIIPRMEKAQGDIPPTERDRDTEKKVLEKDIQQYSMEIAITVESKDIQKGDVQNWERDSKEIVRDAERGAIRSLNAHTEREKAEELMKCPEKRENLARD